MQAMTIHAAVLQCLNTRWMQLHEIRSQVWFLTGHYCETTAISARIRDLRKVRYGSHAVSCRFMDNARGKKAYQYGIAE